MKAINKQILQAKRASYSMIAKAWKLQLPIDIQLHILDTCLLPILLSGCEILGFANLQNVEVFDNQYCKHLLNLGSKTVNNIALGELGWFKIETFVKERMLNFWIRLATSKTSKISFAIYQHTKNLFDSGEFKSDWLANVKSSVDQIHLSHLWDAPQEELKPEFLKLQFNLKL